MTTTQPETWIFDAEESDCKQFRYSLRRSWAVGSEALFVMLNPSTADHRQDDPTIRRCEGFARRWGCCGFSVVNLWAYRATKPAALRAAGFPTGGPYADRAIVDAVHALDGELVLAWGGNVNMRNPHHADRVGWLLRVAKRAGATPLCLGTTKSGQPRHPLMLAYSTELEPWLDEGRR